MKLPRLKIRNNTRSTLVGLMIGVASLWALTMAYDEARDNILSFFFYTIVLLVFIAIGAICVVAVIYSAKWIMRRLFAQDGEDRQE